jgi:transcription elongation factor GreB
MNSAVSAFAGTNSNRTRLPNNLRGRNGEHLIDSLGQNVPAPMSRAFVKEDVEIAERSGRRRLESGLPPGALNYLTAAGAECLRARLAALRAGSGADEAEISRLECILASATIVEPQVRPETVTFGALVTVRTLDGTLETYRVVGVDEVALESGNVSWVSALGKALLGAEVGQRLKVPGDENAVLTVVKIS